MAEKTSGSGFLRWALRHLAARSRISAQDLVLKTGNEDDVDLTLLFMSKGSDRSLRLIKGS